MKKALKLYKLICVISVLLMMSSCFFIPAIADDTASYEAESIYDNTYDNYVADAVAESRDYFTEALPEYNGRIGDTDVVTVTEGENLRLILYTDRAGWYYMGFLFVPNGENNKYTVCLSVNGKTPFLQAQEIDFYSAFCDNGAISQDNAGNDMRPNSVAADVLQKQYFRDSGGSYRTPYMFYLEGGENTIDFTVKSGKLAVNALFAEAPKELTSYEQYLKAFPEKTDKTQKTVLIEAETPTLKSDRSIIADTDRSGPDSTYGGGKKNDAFALKLNIINDENFKYQNQWVEYEFEVPKTGFYKISMRVRQNLLEGMFTSRRVYIDGSVPFRELDAVEFPYEDSWYIKTLGDKEPYSIWLDAGRHSIRIEVTSGVMAELTHELNAQLEELNSIYRDIFMVTGSSPNMYMDYDLGNQIPDLTERFKAINERLKNSLDRLIEISGGRKGTGFSVMDSLIVQISDFVKNTDTVEDRVSAYKDNCSAFGSWIASLKEQPLGIDSIEISGTDNDAYSNKANFFEKLYFQIKVLIGSFINDYDTVSHTGGTNLDVWVMNGREHAQVVKDLSKNYFTKAEVNISVVTAGLVEATLAGTGPDVALFVPETTPVFMGARGVLTDISKFDGFNTLASYYDDELLVPYTYKEAAYGVPLTYDMPMLFYRTDVFEDLGLQYPATWSDFYDAVSVIQNSLLDVGIPYTLFETLLYQNGGSYFNDSLDSCVLDSDQGVAAFEQITEFFTDHALPVSFDFYNRFRTGEMPLAIAAYSNYMTLEFAAPEISGLWEMAPIPTNGDVEKYLKGESTAAVIFEKTENKNAAIEFLLWFCDATTQGQYGQEIEIVLGAVGRHKPANKQALEHLGWSVDDCKLIQSQFNVVREIPVIPSSYYISRSFNNAFRKVVYSGENARETLLLYVRDINKEISRKQEVMDK